MKIKAFEPEPRRFTRSVDVVFTIELWSPTAASAKLTFSTASSNALYMLEDDVERKVVTRKVNIDAGANSVEVSVRLRRRGTGPEMGAMVRLVASEEDGSAVSSPRHCLIRF